jgi:signal transduction histidine kinase
MTMGLTAAAPELSSTESFLDDYQAVRLVISTIGVAVLLVLIPSVGWALVAPYVIGLGLIGGHAVWCRLRHIRSPRSMLLLDTTLWGAVMVKAGDPTISAASVAFLFVLAVLFAHGLWRVGFLAVSTVWYAVSMIEPESATPGSLGRVAGVFLITGGLAMMIHRVRQRVGRLDAERSQMLGTVSHELRNHLTGVLGLTQLVGTGPDLTESEIRELVDMAHQQAADASEIVEDLLTVTRLERSALSVTLGHVNVNDEVATTVRRFTGEGVRLSVETAPDLPLAVADALRVRQILRNLVSNAVRYGGTSIQVTTLVTGEAIQIVVADNGGGVPPEDEATLFLAYRRSTVARDASSIGLGLWISHQLARAMRGDLVYRRIDGRTEFVVSLPIRGRTAGRTDLELDGTGAELAHPPDHHDPRRLAPTWTTAP